MPASAITSVPIDTILAADKTSEYVLNNHRYEFEAYITNSTSAVVRISPTAIKNLTIEETLADWVTRGSLTVNFDNDLIEYLQAFKFRNDGEDVIRIRIFPQDDSLTGPSLRATKKIWELNYIFSITDILDVTPKTRGNTDSSSITKIKKFVFCDIRYQLMISRNIQYSTGQSKLAPAAQTTVDPAAVEDPRQLYSDASRSIPTHEAIKEIIEKTFDSDPVLSKNATSNTDNPAEWSAGITNIFYTSGAANTANQDLDYVFGRHVGSNNNDMCLLTIEREEGGIGYFSLRQISDYFKLAGTDTPGDFQIEHLFLRNSFKDGSFAGKRYLAPVLDGEGGSLTNNMVVDIKINDFNVIDKYEFVDITPLTNTVMFKTVPVYSFDFKNRQFNIEFSNHALSAAESVFQNDYISNLKSNGGDNFLLKTNTPTKINNSNITPVFSLYGSSETPEQRYPDGLHRLLKTGLFQNTCINFIVPGLTFREPGRFIGIDRFGGSESGNPLDDKLCGQWFVINVIHIFQAGMYYNEVTAVKVHRFNGVNFGDYVGDIPTERTLPGFIDKIKNIV
jgi:hypothetical protein